MTAPRISAETARVLKTCGWDVHPAGRLATLAYARGECVWRGVLYADGSWHVEQTVIPREAPRIAAGRDVHPASAAMDVHEILWALRDGRTPPEHVRRYLTTD